MSKRMALLIPLAIIAAVVLVYLVVFVLAADA